MDNQNNEPKSLFENKDIDNMHIESEVKEQNVTNQENVVTPIAYKRDLGDKTIDAVENFVNSEDHKNEFSPEEVKKYKTTAILNYIPLVSLYYIFTSKYKESKYLHFHVNQGLITTLSWIITFLVSKILSSVFVTESYIIDNTPGWVDFISYIFLCISGMLTLYGIINTSYDSSKEFPLIGKFKLLK